MIDYKLDDLGWFEFEQLVQSLVKCRIGLGIEAWGGRGDWGRDAYYEGKLRFPTNEEVEGVYVFQAKFIENANAAGAKTEKLIIGAIQKECENIKKHFLLRRWNKIPYCYSLFTNAPISPSTRELLIGHLATVLPETRISIHGGNDLCQWLRMSPEIVRSFPQLLSLRDLQDLIRDTVNSEIVVRSKSAIALAQSYSRVFIPTDAYYFARDKLHRFGFVVLEGPPEMGKTTIGRVIALSQIFLGWEALECRSPSEVLKMYRSDAYQVFVADDFFGRTEYEPMRVSEWQSELAHIIPLLDSKHWLILTCRAHLLKMAKSDLDISGQNHRFPSLGEVVVDAGKLKRGEKARILYRHAKAFALDVEGKAIIRAHATSIVDHRHFTPERIRRLIEELIPSFVIGKYDSDSIKHQIADALSNPTKQMRVTFRKLPSCHRWLLFALLETDRTSVLFDVANASKSSLQSSYETLCPAQDQRPFDKVLIELTEAFVKKSPRSLTPEIDWIHPSCRDLAIEQLAESPGDRGRFLTSCSEKGLLLASSLGGGALGMRDLPLLLSASDWSAFSSRLNEVIKTRPAFLRSIWFNYEEVKDRISEKPPLQQPALLLKTAIKQSVVSSVAPYLGGFAYSNAELLRNYFEVCRDLEINPPADLSEAWKVCLDEVNRWVNGRWVIWQDTGVPCRVSDFIRTIGEFHPDELQSLDTRNNLDTIVRLLIERADEEKDSHYGDPKDEEEVRERADSFGTIGQAFETLSELTFWDECQQNALSSSAFYFVRQAENLRENLPDEEEEDGDSSSDRSPDEDMSIDDLFRDL
jgi:hypothetical protein